MKERGLDVSDNTAGDNSVPDKSVTVDGQQEEPLV